MQTNNQLMKRIDRYLVLMCMLKVWQEKGDKNMNALNFALILLICMCIGFFANRFKVVDANFLSSLSSLVFKFIFPAMIINSMRLESATNDIINIVDLVIIASVSLVVMFFVGTLMNRLTKCAGDKAQVLRFGIIYPNFTYMAFPVMEALYGQKGLFYISIFTVPIRISYYILSGFLIKGIGTMKDKAQKRQYILSNIKKALINPAVLSVPIGLCIYFLRIPLPFFVSKTISILAATASPLGMIISGLALPQKGFKDAFLDKKILFQTFVRLAVAPFLALLLLRMVNIDPLVRNISILYCAMPTASSAVVFALNFKSDVSSCAKSVLVSTVFSILTLPLWTLVLSTLN